MAVPDALDLRRLVAIVAVMAMGVCAVDELAYAARGTLTGVFGIRGRVVEHVQPDDVCMFCLCAQDDSDGDDDDDDDSPIAIALEHALEHHEQTAPTPAKAGSKPRPRYQLQSFCRHDTHLAHAHCMIKFYQPSNAVPSRSCPICRNPLAAETITAQSVIRRLGWFRGLALIARHTTKRQDVASRATMTASYIGSMLLLLLLRLMQVIRWYRRKRDRLLRNAVHVRLPLVPAQPSIPV
ncbi:hypothetical protein BC831DRAFT_466305 [Entophlyctis helioformis]|nr:hypothetical protein BC831DRAFT_466305 [Entophlyctis helioformis]